MRGIRRVLSLTIILTGAAPGEQPAKPSPIGFRTPAATEAKKAAEAKKTAGDQSADRKRIVEPVEIFFDAHTGTACFLSESPGQMTATHPNFPAGAQVRVTRLSNGKSVVVTITGNAQFSGDRIIGVSRRAAEELGFISSGTTKVRLEPVNPSTL